jgi:RNA polymerase sigma-70 factor (ECF subfamily)
MGVSGEVAGDGSGLLDIYDRALPQIYGYFLSRCREQALAEDLTSETFLAAARDRSDGSVSVAWLVGVARHKLADHWRRQAREERLLRAVETMTAESQDPWDEHVDALRARQALDEVAPQHRAALTLRYVDGLPVAEVASVLGRTVDATEALLVRARRDLRRVYEEEVGRA